MIIGLLHQRFICISDLQKQDREPTPGSHHDLASKRYRHESRRRPVASVASGAFFKEHLRRSPHRDLCEPDVSEFNSFNTCSRSHACLNSTSLLQTVRNDITSSVSLLATLYFGLLGNKVLRT